MLKSSTVFQKTTTRKTHIAVSAVESILMTIVITMIEAMEIKSSSSLIVFATDLMTVFTLLIVLIMPIVQDYMGIQERLAMEANMTKTGFSSRILNLPRKVERLVRHLVVVKVNLKVLMAKDIKERVPEREMLKERVSILLLPPIALEAMNLKTQTKRKASTLKIMMMRTMKTQMSS